jgi:molecular chaperone GrpE
MDHHRKHTKMTAQERSADPAPAPPSEAVAPAELTPEQLGELREKAARAEEHWDRLLRTTADFDNFKKRAARERQDAVRFANEALLTRLLPALDSFDMALTAAASPEGASLDSLKTGIAMVHSQLKAALADVGLEEIDAQGQPFDPNLHEAVSQEESDAVAEGCVLRQVRKGYRLRERLIRPASVIVARKPGA